MLRGLDNMHILKIYEFFEDMKYFYIITEHTEGGNLY